MNINNEGRALTDEHRQFLQTASQKGYFSVPREITLRELANEHDMSGQEASEVLRTAINTAMREEVFVNE